MWNWKIDIVIQFHQSSEAMSMVKQDLAEFVSTIQQDTSTVVADTATAVKESLKVLDIKHPLYM